MNCLALHMSGIMQWHSRCTCAWLSAGTCLVVDDFDTPAIRQDAMHTAISCTFAAEWHLLAKAKHPLCLDKKKAADASGLRGRLPAGAMLPAGSERLNVLVTIHV